MIDMLAFHSMRDGMVETLNKSATFASGMQKHARQMFLDDWCYFCRHKKIASIFSIVAGVAICV